MFPYASRADSWPDPYEGLSHRASRHARTPLNIGGNGQNPLRLGKALPVPARRGVPLWIMEKFTGTLEELQQRDGRNLAAMARARHQRVVQAS